MVDTFLKKAGFSTNICLLHFCQTFLLGKKPEIFKKVRRSQSFQPVAPKITTPENGIALKIHIIISVNLFRNKYVVRYFKRNFFGKYN